MDEFITELFKDVSMTSSEPILSKEQYKDMAVWGFGLHTKLDDKIIDKDKTYWKVTLNDGMTVYQDDDNPDFTETSWQRLKSYCYMADVYIVDMEVTFRSHTESVGKNADGYFFRKSILGSIGQKKRKPDVHYYLTGTLNSGILTVTKWRVPELLSQGTHERDPNCPRLVGECLIRNKNVQVAVN